MAELDETGAPDMAQTGINWKLGGLGGPNKKFNRSSLEVQVGF